MDYRTLPSISASKAKHMGIHTLVLDDGEGAITLGLTPLMSFPLEGQTPKTPCVYMADAETFYQLAREQNHPNLLDIKKTRDDVKMLIFIEKRQKHQDEIMKKWDDMDVQQRKIVQEDQEILNEITKRHGQRRSFEDLVEENKNKKKPKVT